MLEFITLISLLCSQPGVGHGAGYYDNGLKLGIQLRQEAFVAQSSCTKRLFKACTIPHRLTKELLPKEPACLVEQL